MSNELLPYQDTKGAALPSAEAVEKELGLRELDARSDHGVSVRLLWREGTADTLIEYIDEKEGREFIETVPSDRAMDAFHHPNAYCRGGGIALLGAQAA